MMENTKEKESSSHEHQTRCITCYSLAGDAFRWMRQ